MKVIILSAGQGSRLLPLTRNVPKCALRLRGRPILEWQLNEIAKCEVSEVVVVTGFAAEHVDRIVRQQHGVPVRTLHNTYYEQYDNLGTCWVARSEMDGPFILLNGDTLFEADVLRSLLAEESDMPITMAIDSKHGYDEDDMKVAVLGRRLVWVGKALNPSQVDGEAIGMIRFQGVGPTLFRDKVESLIASRNGANLWYLSAIDALAQGYKVDVCRVGGHSWCEIDDRADLAHAQTVIDEWYSNTNEQMKVFSARAV